MVDIITTAISFAALVFLGAQVPLARKAINDASAGQEREWARQRRKAAIDVIVDTAPYRESLKSTVPWNDRDPESMAAFFERTKGDHEMLAPVREYLNHLEDLAVGVKQGVYDLETVSILEGSRLIDIVVSYSPYIESTRRELNRPTLWNDLDDLANLLKALRQEQTKTQEVKTLDTPIIRRNWLKRKPANERP